MTNRYEILLAGEGGQGIVLAGTILTDAIATGSDKNVVLTRSYGPEQRGGAVQTEIVISDEEIDYPKVLAANLLLALTQEAFDNLHHQVIEGGVIIVDPSQVKATDIKGVKIESVPLKEIAIKIAGDGSAANMVALGVISGLTKLIPPKALLIAMRRHTPKKGLKNNEVALKKGIEIGRAIQPALP